MAQQQVTLSDLEWPLYASRAISAVAEILVVLGQGCTLDPARRVYDATLDHLIGRVGDAPCPFFTQSTLFASQFRRHPLALNPGHAREYLATAINLHTAVVHCDDDKDVDQKSLTRSCQTIDTM